MDEHADAPLIVRAALAGGFLRANKSFLDLVAIPEAELSQKPLVDWIHPDDQPSLRQVLDQGSGSCRVRHLKADGGSVFLDVHLRDQEGDPVVLGRCAETNDADSDEVEPQAEATVKSTLHTIAKIVEEQNPGYKCSILLVADGRFVKGAGPSLPEEYNDAIDGFAIGPCVGSCGTAIYWNVPVVVEDIQNDPLWTPFAKLAKTAGVAACWSHPFATKGGRVLGALAFYSPVPAAPTKEQLSRLRAAAQMTGLAVERGRAEEELRHASEVKTRFLANMSHEIRTPLNALIGITDALQETPGLPHDELRMLRESGEQLVELFSSAIELTELQGRRHAVSAIDVRGRCRELFAPFEGEAYEKGLGVEFSVSADVPRWGSVDDWAFRRALPLFFHNAVKFTEEGSISVSVGYGDGDLLVRISDSGCGIDLDRIEELRKPFVQGDLSTTKQYSGFGIGLALGDLCVEALGGTLEFSAKEPKGTTVELRIPLPVASSPGKQAPALPQRNVSDVQAGAPRLPVLVVEDNQLNSKVLKTILDRAGYACQVVENGEKAVEALDANAYSCILMDCQMPVMDGYEATRRIRAREEGTGQRVPIIAVTANALAGDRDLCLQAGMDDYLKKPVRKQQLVGTLLQHLGADVPPLAER